MDLCVQKYRKPPVSRAIQDSKHNILLLLEDELCNRLVFDLALALVLVLTFRLRMEFVQDFKGEE